MLNPEMQPLIPVNLYGKSDILFGNMEDIFRFHNDVFLRDLENCINTPELIGLCFVQRVSSLQNVFLCVCLWGPWCCMGGWLDRKIDFKMYE